MQNRYLVKHAKEIELIGDMPDQDLEMVIVIPCFDEPNLELCLDSLYAATRPDDLAIEILVLLNYPESASSPIKETSHKMLQHLSMCDKYNTRELKLHVHLAVFADRQAGVGLARKTAMDEAVRRFDRLNKDGIIVNLDADCLVADNYFLALRAFYFHHPKIWAAGIHFEHRLDESFSRPHVKAIIAYELHLRYFIAAQRGVGLPFGFQTIGSCMTVRSSAYQRMGGMNVRKAGEDFYFLHKFIAINRFAEINDTTVYPSARDSGRVPFGTGRAINASLHGGKQETYAWTAFMEVKSMVKLLPELYTHTNIVNWIDNLPPVLRNFFLKNNASRKLFEIKRETSRYDTFLSRFYQWFNAFRLMKYLHFARSIYPDRPVIPQSLEFLQLQMPEFQLESDEQLLNAYRMLTRSTII